MLFDLWYPYWGLEFCFLWLFFVVAVETLYWLDNLDKNTTYRYAYLTAIIKAIKYPLSILEYMWFHIQVIKQVAGQRYSMKLVIQAETQNILDSFLRRHDILVMKQQTYTQDVQKFGDVYGRIHDQWIDYDIVVAEKSMHDAIYTMLLFGWDIIAINSHSNALEPREAIAAIGQIQEEIRQSWITEQRPDNRTISREQIQSVDTQHDTIQHIVDQVLEDMQVASKQYTPSPEHLQQIQEHTSTIQKIRLSKNTDKIKDVIRDIYKTIGDIEQSYTQTLEPKPIATDSYVTNNMLFGLYNKRHRMTILQDSGALLHRWDKLYARFGKQYILIQLGIHDFRKSFVNRRLHADRVFRLLLVGIIVAICTNTLVGLIASLQHETIQMHIVYSRLRLGVLWVALWIGYIISKKTHRHTSTILFASIILFACLHYAARWLLMLS